MLDASTKKILFDAVLEGKIAGAAELTAIVREVLAHPSMAGRLWTVTEIIEAVERCNNEYELLQRRKMSRFSGKE